MPDGKTYGITAPVSIEHKEIVKLVDELIENPNSRLAVDQAGGINLVNGGRNNKVRIYKEMSK